MPVEKEEEEEEDCNFNNEWKNYPLNYVLAITTKILLLILALPSWFIFLTFPFQNDTANLTGSTQIGFIPDISSGLITVLIIVW